jgi:hypothetical protein
MNATTETGHVGRVLVVRGSPDRATAEIAETITDELRATCLQVDLTVPRAGGLAGYHGVVIGSRLLLGHWNPTVGRFLRRHAPVLRVRPLWLFQVDPHHLHRAAAGALTGLVDDALPRLLTEVLDQPAVVTFHPDGTRAGASDTRARRGSPVRLWARTIAATLRDHATPALADPGPASESQESELSSHG